MIIMQMKTESIVKSALDEDIGSGDITTESVIPKGMKVHAEIKAKEDCIICGLDVAEMVFSQLDSSVEFRKLSDDGKRAKAGEVIAEIRGNARAILTGERTALNFLQRLSGIATKAGEMSEIVKKSGVDVLDTRKTTPGLRALEKYAVRCGGCRNHRMGLYDQVLIKDNHITLVGLQNAVRNAKRTGKKVEVEARDMAEVKDAVAAGADIIMLDNMSSGDMRAAVREIAGKAVIEVSGGVNKGRLRELTGLGVQWISIGSLTHSVRSIDIGMYIRRA